MLKDDWEFLERINLDLKAREAAREILEVKKSAAQEDLKKAYRKACLKYHPDHKGQTPEANKRFTLVKCAYELLAADKPCPALLEEIDSWRAAPYDKKYRLDNPWGYFLWWRENFYAPEQSKDMHDKGTSCI
jgi:hypothetical protein